VARTELYFHGRTRRSRPLCCQAPVGVACSCALECGPVLAGVKIVPASAHCAGVGGAAS
jgi:hypothetical protein